MTSIRLLPGNFFNKDIPFRWWWLLIFQFTRNVKTLIKYGINDYTFQAYEYWEKRCEEENITVPYSYFRYWNEHLLEDCGIKTRLHPDDKADHLIWKCPKGYIWGDLPRGFKSKEKWT